MKKIIVFIIVVVIIAAAWFFFFNTNESNKESYSFAEIKRGDINTIITSSGSIEAVSTVEVGTQVSGRITKIYADFNDHVKRGQLLATLDTTFLSASVTDQKAGLAKAQAQYNEALSKFERNKKLFKQKYISELDYIVSETAVQTAKASLQSAHSGLERAITNLNYAFIKSPIEGTIINRNVEAGQTVASSFSTPTLFTIAEDLSNMQILAQVDESDIGEIKDGQKVIFTVQAYDRNFEGTVKQIRLQPQTVQNVVNYTVVVKAKNESGLLLPGMTATVDFYVEEKKDVLIVPNSALRFKPTQQMLDSFKKQMEERRKNLPNSSKMKRQGNQGKRKQRMASFFSQNGSGGKNNFAQLWEMDSTGNFKMHFSRTGSTDGKNTEIVHGRGIKEGMKIISEVNNVSEEKSTNNSRMGRGFGRF